MGLLFINALKGLKKKKIQMLGIILLIILGTSIFTTMNLALDRMEDTYYDYIDDQNVQDFGLTPNIDYKKDYTYQDVINIIKNNPNLELSYKYVINNYAECLKTKKDKCFTSELLEQVSGVFNIANLNKEKYAQKIKKLSEEHNFTYEYHEIKTITSGKYTTVVIPYKDYQISKPYLLEGKFPQNINEITVLKLFAESNNLNIGDYYKINDEEYKIVGYAYASNYIYPLLSITSPMYDKKYNNIIFAYEEEFKNINGILSSDYVGVFNDRDNFIENFSKLFNINFATLEKISDEATDASLSMEGMLSLTRTKSPEMELETNRLFAEYFMYFLLSICVLVIIIITKKRIDDEKLQIGVLKSLGYKAVSIATSYLVYPIVGSIVGGSLGYLIGHLLNPVLMFYYKTYYCFPMGENLISLKYLFYTIFIPLVFLVILSYIVAIFMLRKKPLALLREGSNLKINFLTKITNTITKKMPFNSRFKYSLASRSIGKLLIIFITSLSSGMLIILTLIGMNLFNSMIDNTLNRYNFNYQIDYLLPQNKVDNESDLAYHTQMKLLKINNKELEDKDNLAVMGIEKSFKSLVLEDSKENILNDKIKGHNVLISKPVSEIYEISTGDKITLSYDEQILEYDVSGIYEDYFNLIVMVDKKIMASDLNISEDLYNIKFTKESDYDTIIKDADADELSQISNMLSINQLKDNLNSAMQMFNASIYIVVGFAAFMSLIIIAVVANIVVEENKKTISLMKVMGYKNKMISNIVLNIYTPFIIIAYFLSIPATIYLLKLIIGALVNNMNVVIPITITWQNVLLGLAGILLAYYIAIFLSKKVLNKVPLAVALKRE